MKKLILILSILILAACAREETNPPPIKEEPSEVQKEEEPKNTVDLSTYFMKDGTTAEFKGEGNEYAHYMSRTQRLYDRYVSVYEDNGGTVMLRTFRIDDDKIVVIQEEGESYETVTPAENELDEMEPMYTYLQLPLNKGATFNGWAVIDEKATLDTPLQEFTDVLVIEKKGEDGSTIRKYFAEGYGEIKREFIMNEGDQEFAVTSTIEKIQ